MELKHPIQVGDIFEQGDTDEDGHVTDFYEVVRLKGKTMVELRAIKKEYSIDDELCQRDASCCRVYPLPGQFCSDDPESLIVAKVEEKDDPEQPGNPPLWRRGCKWWQKGWFYPYDPNDAYYNTGYWGGCNRYGCCLGSISRNTMLPAHRFPTRPQRK